MKKSKRKPEKDPDIQYLRTCLKMSPAQRLRWLEETQDFFLKALPKSTFRAQLKLRTAENK
jgi:hypothetical protein